MPANVWPSAGLSLLAILVEAKIYNINIVGYEAKIDSYSYYYKEGHDKEKMVSIPVYDKWIHDFFVEDKIYKKMLNKCQLRY